MSELSDLLERNKIYYGKAVGTRSTGHRLCTPEKCPVVFFFGLILYFNFFPDKASGPEIEMPPPPYFKGGTYDIICSMRRLLQEPKYYEVTIGGINCTTSFSYNKTSETASVLCQKR